MEIKQMIIAKEFQSGRALVPKWITIHETDNENTGADANAHARLQARGNDRDATWHYQVDDKEIIQSVPDNADAWAAGDGVNGPGNDTSLHIEICVNKDGNFKIACENAAWLVNHLMAKHNLGIDKVVQHNKWTGKNCPRHLRAGDWGLTWASFIDMCRKSTKDGWVSESGKWYFYKDGKMQTSWIKDGGKDYFLDQNGIMQTGWLKWSGKWYYLDSSGAMKTGWVFVDGKWYYLNSNGSMATGEITVKGKKYLLRADGSLVITDKNGEIQ